MHHRLAVLIAVASVTLASCSQFGPGDEVGVWECVSVNGHDVPGTVPLYLGSQTGGLTIVYERFRLEAGGGCTLAYSYEGIGADSATNCTHAVQFDEGTITITVNVTPLNGSIDGHSMTLVDANEGGPDNVSLYHKR
jgi:hypothetical protein